MTNDSNNNRISNFDLIKFIASILIVFHHFQQDFDIRFKYINFFGGFFNFSFLVELFFMISGFLAIASIKNNRGFLKNIINRLKKLYPFVFLTLVVNLLLTYTFYLYFGLYPFNTSYNLIQIVTSFLLINQGWLYQFAPAVNNPIWYICVLFLLYIIFYGIRQFTANPNNSHRIQILIYTSIVIIGIIGRNIRVNLPFLGGKNCRGYSAFFIGVLCFYLYKYIRKKLIISKTKYISLALIIFGFLFIFYSNNFNWNVWTIIICPAIIILACTTRQLDSKHMKFFGDLSFHIYLWHYPLSVLELFVLDVYKIQMPANYFGLITHTIFVCLVSLLIFQLDKKLKTYKC